MASIFKRADSVVWWAQYYVPDQTTNALKQVRRSTAQRKKKAALIAAIEMERTAQGVLKAGTDKAQRAKAVLAQAVADIERDAFTTLSARKYLAELMAIATGDELLTYTVEKWMQEWLRRKARGSTKSTMARYNKNIGSFLQWLGDERKGKPLESVTIAHVREWRELLQDEGRAGKTVNNYVKDVSASFRAAVREGLTNFNPCGALEAVSTEDSLDRQPFSTADVIALLGAAPTSEWRGLILIAAFTGLRLGDAARLQWKSIDLEQSLITLVPSKTKRKKREVRIPIQPDLMEFLIRSHSTREVGVESVLPELSAKHINGKLGLSVLFTQIMEKAAVDRGKASREVKDPEKGAGRNVFERGFHSLRHTFTSWLRTAGVAEEDRMALTGHSTRESHAIYSHTDAAALSKAIEKLPKL